MWELRSSPVQFRSFEPRGLFAPVCMAHFLWGIFKWLLMAVKRNAESREQRACGSQRAAAGTPHTRTLPQSRLVSSRRPGGAGRALAGQFLREQGCSCAQTAQRRKKKKKLQRLSGEPVQGWDAGPPGPGLRPARSNSPTRHSSTPAGRSNPGLRLHLRWPQGTSPRHTS